MFSVIFPGQGSQSVGMCKEFYEKHNLVKQIYKNADDILKINLSKLILEGPSNELNKTENTQPAIFLTSYSIFKLIEKETSFKVHKAKYFAVSSISINLLIFSKFSDLIASNNISICARAISLYLPTVLIS